MKTKLDDPVNDTCRPKFRPFASISDLAIVVGEKAACAAHSRSFAIPRDCVTDSYLPACSACERPTCFHFKTIQRVYQMLTEILKAGKATGWSAKKLRSARGSHLRNILRAGVLQHEKMAVALGKLRGLPRKTTLRVKPVKAGLEYTKPERRDGHYKPSAHKKGKGLLELAGVQTCRNEASQC